MKIKDRVKVIAMAMIPAVEASAQTVEFTFDHDEAKMNQITVMETGVGSLTPTAYYEVIHEKYSEDAAKRNKLARRSDAGIAAYTQKDDAVAMDSAMARQGRIETLNVADRSGGVLDAAWTAEGARITAKMEDFQKNINRITEAGGSASDRNRWQEQYDMLRYAIEATQEAYMPNAERKKSYADIMSDLQKRNETLVQYLVRLQNSKRTSQLRSARSGHKVDKSQVTSGAMDRWKARSGQGEQTFEK
ncbi:MAG: DUF5045 domain-containing protein [Bacteroidaceae bacterium]|nr:DUF5045 domain-containing protein [Bacteroidaceae bacterium]